MRFLLASACLTATVLAENKPAGTTVISASRRFVVRGAERGTCVAWLLWIENADKRITASLEQAPPIDYAEPLYVYLQSNEETLSPPVFALQAYPDSLLQQKLYINVAKFSMPEVLEGLCQLLCNRYVIALQTKSERSEKLALMPAWLSVGLALNLYPPQKSHFSALAMAVRNDGALPSVREILEMESLPLRIDPQSEAVCCVFTRWLLSLDDSGKIFRRIVNVSSRHQSVKRRDLIVDIADINDIVELEKSWELSVAKLMEVERISSLPSTSQIMKELLTLQKELPQQYSVLAGVAVESRNLVSFRGEIWMDDLCARMCVELHRLMISSDEEVRAVISCYYDFFSKLTEPNGGWLSRVFGHSISDDALKNRFQLAERRRIVLNTQIERCEAYLDQVEANIYNQPLQWEYEPSVEEIEYVDEQEKRLRAD